MDSELRNMVMAFRVSELQCLLGFAGKCKTGRKSELQARALELVRSKPGHIATKIRELYRTIQLTLNQQAQGPASATGSGLYLGHGATATAKLYSTSNGYSGAHEKVLQGRSPFASFNAPTQNKVSTNVALISMPVCPDVRIKKLPFYDILGELIKPTSLISSGPVRMQEGAFPFFLTPKQVNDIAASKELQGDSLYPSEQKIGYQIQVQLRFCLLDVNGEQPDNFPPSICVRVNGKIVPLPHPIPSNRPGVEPKRPAKALNVTNYVKLSPTSTNTIGITWVSDGLGRGWVMCLYLVKKLDSSDLLQRLKTKGARPAEFTKGMIKEIVMKDDGECQIAMTSFVVSMACPLGKCRMSLPCRATTCAHLQCFDANLFLQMNEKKPTWTCPVCDKPTSFDNLSIDGYFQEIINSLSFDSGNEIEVFPDGSWKKIHIKKEKDDSEPVPKRIKKEVQLDSTICLDDDLIIDVIAGPSVSGSASHNSGPKKVVDVVDLTLSDSDEEEDEEDSEPTIRVRRRPLRIVDESSSSSSCSTSSSSSSSSDKSDASSTKSKEQNQDIKATIQSSVPRPSNSSPAIITLDSSSSPSPEPLDYQINRIGSYGAMNYFQPSRSNNAHPHASDELDFLSHPPEPLPPISSANYSNSTSQLPALPSTISTSARRPSSPSLLSSAYSNNHLATVPNPGLFSYDSRNSWDTGFPNGDFGTLDFDALDFLDYEQPSAHSSYHNHW